MKTIFFIILFFLSTGIIFSQSRNRSTLTSTNKKGALFIQGGLNKSFYSQTTADLNTSFYQYSLSGLKMNDNEKQNLKANLRLGIFFANKWALVLSYNHYQNYIREGQVHLKGQFDTYSKPDPTITPAFSGHYDEDINLTHHLINIEQNRLDLFSAGIQRNDLLFTNRTDKFAIQSVLSFRVSYIVTNLDYNFDGIISEDIISRSGVAFSGNLGLKFEISKLVFLQTGMDLGFINQNKIQIYTASEDYLIKQKFWFFSPYLELGFSIPMVRANKGCGSCPTW